MEIKENILVIDLSARLPYGVIIQHPDLFNPSVSVTEKLEEYYKGHFGSDGVDVEFVKPYLRSMSSMTEEERKELIRLFGLSQAIQPGGGSTPWYNIPETEIELVEFHFRDTYKLLDWLNAHHFDYRGLIKMGLALEAPKGMYNFK